MPSPFPEALVLLEVTACAVDGRTRCSPGGTTGAEELFGGRRVPTAAPGKCSTATAAPSSAGLLAVGFPPKPHCRPGAGAAARSSGLVRVSALQHSPVTV